MIGGANIQSDSGAHTPRKDLAWAPPRSPRSPVLVSPITLLPKIFYLYAVAPRRQARSLTPYSYSLEYLFSNLSMRRNEWRASKNRLLDPTPRVSDSVCLMWGLRVCMSSKLPGDANAAAMETILREPHFRRLLAHGREANEYWLN